MFFLSKGRTYQTQNKHSCWKRFTFEICYGSQRPDWLWAQPWKVFRPLIDSVQADTHKPQRIVCFQRLQNTSEALFSLHQTSPFRIFPNLCEPVPWTAVCKPLSCFDFSGSIDPCCIYLVQSISLLDLISSVKDTFPLDSNPISEINSSCYNPFSPFASLPVSFKRNPLFESSPLLKRIFA